MNEILVIDASLALKAILPGLSQAAAKSLIMHWKENGYLIYAPVLWLYEVTSSLTKGVRFGELSPTTGRRALNSAMGMGVEIITLDRARVYRAFEWTLRLGRAAAYDSFYLALAEELGCDFWTADIRLCNAVNLPWVRSLEA